MKFTSKDSARVKRSLLETVRLIKKEISISKDLRDKSRVKFLLSHAKYLKNILVEIS